MSKFRPYAKILATVIVCSLLLTMGSWLVQRKITAITAKNAADVVSSVLNITHQGMLSWFKGRKTDALIWADNRALLRYTEQLLAGPKTPAELINSPAQKELRAWFAPVIAARGYRGFFVIGPDNINLASTRDTNLGALSLLTERQEFLNRVWAGQPSISLPQKSDAALPGREGVLMPGLPTMFAASPIINEAGDKIAILAFRLDTFADFSAILHRGRIGASGETYAFDDEGHMISESRFMDRLFDMGLMGNMAQTDFQIRLIDPGVNLTAGEQSILPPDRQPLTLMARTAISGKNGINVQGYRDYRGVQVIGAWLWDEDLHFGIASEIDYDEVYAGMQANQIVLTLATILLALPIAGFAWIFLNRAERRKSKEAIEDSEKRLRHVVSGIPHGIIMLDSNRRLLAWNHIFMEIFDLPDKFLYEGMDSLEIPRHLARKSYYGKGDPETLAQKRQDQLWDTASRQSEIAIPDGRIFEVLNLQTREGNLLSTYTDITHRKQMAAELNRAHRMEAVGQLTGGVAHHFNNMLAMMLGNTELLEDNIRDNPGKLKYTANLKQLIDRAAALTQRLLAFSRQQMLSAAPTNIGLVLGELEERLRPGLEQNVTLEMNLADDLWPALVDAAFLGNALDNLAENAVDAMAQGGGRLMINARNTSLDDAYADLHEEVNPGDYVKISVSDSGHGMAPEVLNRMFEPFYTTKDVGQGSGLNMSMVYGFIKQTRGHITAHSEIDRGTTITLYLPRATEGP